MNTQKEIAEKYQGLFDLMQQEHGLILTCEEMDEVINEAQRAVKLFAIPFVSKGEAEPLPTCNICGYWLYKDGTCLRPTCNNF